MAHRLTQDIAKEAGSVRERSDPEDLRDRLAEIREGPANADVGAWPDATADEKHRDELARVVRARRGRVVAVIGCDDEEVPLAQPRQQPRQARVESFQVAAYPAGSLRCPYCVSKSTRFVKTNPVPAVSIAASIASTPSSSDFVCTEVVMPRPAKRSLILPMAWTGWPAPSARRGGSVPVGVSA